MTAGFKLTHYRKTVFKYAVFGHFSTCLTDADNPVGWCGACPPDRAAPTGMPAAGSSGTSEMPGNDFMITLGDTLDNPLGSLPVDPYIEGGIFMHELGHTLGLHHAGDVPGPAFMPNYLSVMNYNYATTGIRHATSPGTVTANEALRTLDYSEHVLGTDDAGVLDLIENHLSESGGCSSLSNPNVAEYNGIMSYFDAASISRDGPEAGPVDWDGVSGIESGFVADDLNADGVGTDVMRGYADWAHPSTTGGACVSSSDCRVNAVRQTVHATDPSVDTHEACVRGVCQPLIYAFQCFPWGLADGPAPASFRVVSGEPNPSTAKASHTLLPPTTATIDVGSGCGENWVAIGGPGVVPVVIFGTADFDTTKIVPTSLQMEGAPAVSVIPGDVNGDGRPDLTANFTMASLIVSPGTTSVTLTGFLTNSQVFSATAPITIARGVSHEDEDRKRVASTAR